MSNWKPPRTRDELYAALSRTEENREYYERVRQFVRKMKIMETYTLDRFVKPENMDLFKTCICVLIACSGWQLEFDETFSKIRLSHEPPEDRDRPPYAIHSIIQGRE